jgi:hypothetical protein
VPIWLDQATRYGLPSSTPIAGIAIGVTDPERRQLHIGVVHADTGAVPHLLHLAFHADLHNEPLNAQPEPVYQVLTVLGDPVRLSAFSAACRRIHKVNRRHSGNWVSVPYGVYLDPATTIDSAGGVKIGPAGAGLSCATFVMKVFESTGISLLREDTWRPRASDLVWHDHIVGILQTYRGGSVPREHVERVRREIGCARFRPEEVAVSLRLPRPTWYAVAAAAGRVLRWWLLRTSP